MFRRSNNIFLILIVTLLLASLSCNILTTQNEPHDKIVFFIEEDVDLGNIYTIDTDGTNMIRLTDDEMYQGDPQWSPDGKKIVIVRDYSIAMMNSNGSGIETIIQNENEIYGMENPVMSPDGKQIAYQHYSNGFTIFIYDIESGKKKQSNGTF